jgi:hypothetical protein
VAGRFKVPVSVWFAAFGEPDNPRVRAERLDEALELVAALLSDTRVARVPIWTGLDHDRTVLRLPSAAFRLAVITS